MSVSLSPDWREQTRNVLMIHQSLYNWKFPAITIWGRELRLRIFLHSPFLGQHSGFLASPLYCYDVESWARFELSELIVSICLIVSLFSISKINLLFYISCGNLQKLDVVEDRRAGPERTNSVSFCVNVCGQKAICWKCPAFYSVSLAPSSRHGAWWCHKRVSSCSKQSD